MTIEVFQEVEKKVNEDLWGSKDLKFKAVGERQQWAGWEWVSLVKSLLI